MTYTIRVTDAEGSVTLEHDKSVDVWAWYDNLCLTSSPDKTIELFQDGEEIQTVSPYPY